MDATIQRDLTECLMHLPLPQQRAVLEFARSLQNTPLAGVAGESLLSFAGGIAKNDLDEISQAISNMYSIQG